MRWPKRFNLYTNELFLGNLVKWPWAWVLNHVHHVVLSFIGLARSKGNATSKEIVNFWKCPKRSEVSPNAQFAIISADELSLLNLSIYQCTKTENDDLIFHSRWHHVESTMNGGITTSVNFWYKVCIIIIIIIIIKQNSLDFSLASTTKVHIVAFYPYLANGKVVPNFTGFYPLVTYNNNVPRQCNKLHLIFDME